MFWYVLKIDLFYSGTDARVANKTIKKKLKQQNQKDHLQSLKILNRESLHLRSKSYAIRLYIYENYPVINTYIIYLKIDDPG